MSIIQATKSILALSISNLIRIASNYDVISFDIFDTLVYRIVADPLEIFDLVEVKYKDSTGKDLEFKRKRIDAEAAARKINGRKDVTLEEIYSHIHDVPDEDMEILKELELDVENKSIVPNPSIIEFYNVCKEMGKKVLLTSDMYLPYEFLVSILNRVGVIGYDNFYLSNVTGKTKVSGEVFAEIANDYKTKKILHIGDKLQADYIQPRRVGIDAFLVKSYKVDMKYKNIKYLKSLDIEKKNDYEKLIEFISATEPSSYDEYERIGFEIIGPILYGFSSWLENCRNEAEIEKLFFLAREGELLEKAYMIVTGNEGGDCSYLRVSRMATSIPCLGMVNTLDELIKRVYLPRAGTVEDLLESCGLDKEYIKDIILQSELLDENKPAIELSLHEKERVFENSKPYIVKQAKEQRKLIDGYMKQEKFFGKCGIVDIGWKGTMQNNLEDLYPENEIYGFYIGLRRDQAATRNQAKNRKGFLFGEEESVTETQRKISATISVFENFFLSTDGSTLRYGMSDGVYFPVLNQPEQEGKSISIIKKTQEAALYFVKEYSKSSFSGCVNISSSNSFAAYEKFAVRPTMNTVKLMRPFIVYNTDVSSLVSTHSLAYYLVHPKKLYKDFLNNTCKVLFLKSIFKLPLPYYEIWKKLHSFDRNPINPIN